MVFSYLEMINGTTCAKGVDLTHIVNTMPPLNTNLTSLGTAPDQNVKMPSFLNIFAAQTKLFLYSLLASIDCILFGCKKVVAVINSKVTNGRTSS